MAKLLLRLFNGRQRLRWRELHSDLQDRLYRDRHVNLHFAGHLGPCVWQLHCFAQVFTPTSSTPNVVWDANCANMIGGSFCSGKCAAGFAGLATATCHLNATFTVTSSCKSTGPATCQGLPAPLSNVTWPASCDGSVQETPCTGSCAEGFTGAAVSICTTAGTWSPASGGCTYVIPTCSGLPPATNDLVWNTECSGQQQGYTCLAACTTGSSGSANSTCLSNGTWSEVAGGCTPVTCAGLPVALSNVTWPDSCAAGAGVGARCLGTCPAGFAGNATSICTAAGSWSSPAGGCTFVGPVTCAGLPPAASNADWPANCSGQEQGFLCVGACTGGTVGGVNSSCSPAGTWTAVSGNCSQPPSCAGLPPAANLAAWPSRCADMLAGVTCTAVCANGSAPGATGSPSSTCTLSGSWAPVSGVCVAITCSGLPAGVSNVTWPASCAGAAARTACTGVCAAGGTGGANSTCGLDGSWSQPSGGCSYETAPVTCKELPAAASNSDWPASCAGQAAGFICNGTCAAGSVGSIASACSPSGNWSEAVGACISSNTTCSGLPPATSNATWPPSCAEQPAGFTCQGACDNGTFGAVNSSCGATGWGGVTGSCSSTPPAIVCQGLPAPANLTTWSDICAGRPWGYTCTGRCAAGSTGRPQSTCLLSGVWSEASGRCTPLPSCGSLPPALPYVTWPDSCKGALVGAICSAECGRGAAAGVVNATCTAAGTWTAVDEACIALRCPAAPPAVPNVHWPSSCVNATAGSSCAGACAANYTGNASAVCLESGDWDQVTNNCTEFIPATCTGPPGQVSNTTNITWPASCSGQQQGFVCRGTCAAGSAGSANATCTPAGTWSSVTGGCVLPPGCPGLPPTTNSTIWPPTCAGQPWGFTCVASCAAGTVGKPTSTCTVAGTWSGLTGKCTPVICFSPPPALSNFNISWPASCAGAVTGTICSGRCQSGSVGGANATCTNSGNWTEPVGGCEPPPFCTDPLPAINGTIWPSNCSGNTAAGSACVGSCDASLGLEGTPAISCSSTGTWGEVTSSCQLKACSGVPPTALFDGSWRCSATTPSGSRCYVTCDPGFIGSPFSECSVGVWGPVVGKCAGPPKGCLSLLDEPHAEPWNCPPGGLVDGTLCTALCNPGWNVTKSATSVCNNGVWNISSCTQVECGDSVPSVAGSVSGVDWSCTGHSAGDQCTAACEAGMVGTRAAVCSAGGTWQTSGTCSSAPAPSCAVAVESTQTSTLPVCKGFTRIRARFLFSTLGLGNVAFTAVPSFPGGGVTCDVTPQNRTGPANKQPINVVCSSSSSFPIGSSKITLRARSTDTSAACLAEANRTDSAVLQVAVYTPPVITMTGVTPLAATCSNAKTASASFRFSVQAAGTGPLQYMMRPFASVPSMACVAQIIVADAASRDGSVVVKCSGGMPAAGNSLTINLQMSASRTDCTPGVDTARVVIPITCCKTTAGFAASTGVPRSQCLQQFAPEDAACKKGGGKASLLNRGPAVGTVRAMSSTGSSTCRLGINLSFYQATCNNADNALTIRLRSYKKSDTTKLLWVGCTKPAEKSCNRFKPPPRGAFKGVDATFRTTQWTVDVPKAGGKAQCACKDMWWSLYEGGSFVGMQDCG